MALPMSVSMSGGSSSAESTGKVGNLDTAGGGGYHGAFLNNFAARGATLDAASSAGDPGLVSTAGNWLLIGAAACGLGALFLAYRKKL